MPLSITAIPALETNYVWALHNARHAVLVDPGEAGAPLDWLAGRRLALAAVLVTHHHYDHTDGISAIVERHPAPVYGPNDERIPQVEHRVGHGDRVRIDPLDIDFEVLGVPGHTTSHIAYYGHGLVLCGDTLFSAGCGRMFEGTPEQMHASLDRLAALPPDTKVLAGHEYTVSNCRFALAVEPGNPSLQARLREAEALRAKNQPTLPSTLGDELEYNPFLRCRQPDVAAAARRREPGRGNSPADVFAVLRRWKIGRASCRERGARAA